MSEQLQRGFSECQPVENELWTEPNFISAVLDTIDALVVVCDCRGRIVCFNRVCEEMTGYALAQVRGNPFWDLFLLPEEVEVVKAVFAELRAGQFPNKYENYWVTKDGSRRLIAWSNTFILDDDGSVAYIIGTGLDITEYQPTVSIENTKLYLKIQQQVDEFETLLAVQQAITGRLESQSVLQLIADAARRLTATRLSIVYLLNQDDLYISVLSSTHSLELSAGYQLPVAGSLAGLAIRSGRSFIVNDAQHDPRIYPDLAQRLKVQSYLALPLMSVSEPIGAIAVADKLEGGDLGPDEERILTMLAPGAVIGLENARLYQKEQERRQEAEERRRVAESLRGILAILNSNRSLDEILAYIAAQTTQLLGADADAIYRLQVEAGILAIQATHGLADDYLAQADIPLDHNAIGKAVLTRRPVAVADVSTMFTNDNPLKPDGPYQTFLAHLMTHYQALLAVPLIIKDEVYGGIVLYYRQSGTFSEEEIALAVTYSDQVALAIENARLRTQAEQVAVAAERSRLARDLHDSVTQAIFSASLVAEVLPQIWQRDPNEAQQSLADLRHLTRGALAEMRTLLLELRPTALLEAKLHDLLRQLTTAITGRVQMQITLALEKAPALPSDVQVALYRIAQEALNNVVKHAEAGQVTVSLYTSPTVSVKNESRWRGTIALSISDDGRGFNQLAISSHHLGLAIMRERAEAIGTTLNIESQPDQGTQITVIWSDSLGAWRNLGE